MAGKQSSKPISDTIKEKLRELADQIVEVIEGALQPEPRLVPIPIRSRYRR